MKICIYKLWCFIDDDNHKENSAKYLFDHVELFTESQLKWRFWEAVENGQIDHDTLDHYGLGDITSNDLCDIDTETIVRLFEREGYTIQKETLDIDEDYDLIEEN